MNSYLNKCLNAIVIFILLSTINSVAAEKKIYLKDHLGSTRAVINETGTVIETYDFYPYGLQMPGRILTSGSSTKNLFTGKEHDAETGWDYFGARYYAAALGRWMGVDPLAEDYPGYSPYNYTLSNPILYIDPDGMVVEFADKELEKRHKELYDKNEEYTVKYKLLHESEVTYRVINHETAKELDSQKFSGTEVGEMFTTDGKTVQIAIKTSAGEDDQKGALIHEFTHGVQFEEGRIQFFSTDGENWTQTNAIELEVEAYQAQEDAGFGENRWRRNITYHDKSRWVRNKSKNFKSLPEKARSIIREGVPGRYFRNADVKSDKEGSKAKAFYFYWKEPPG